MPGLRHHPALEGVWISSQASIGFTGNESYPRTGVIRVIGDWDYHSNQTERRWTP